MRKALLLIIGLAVGVGLYFGLGFQKRHATAPDFAEHCAAPLRSTAEVQQAMEDGFEVDQGRRCIRKRGYEEASRSKLRLELEAKARARDASDAGKPHEAARRSAAQGVKDLEVAAVQAARAGRETGAGPSLGAARTGFKTTLSVPSTGKPPLPNPPRELFVRIDYDSAVGPLPAFVSPAPNDGDKHPAIVWLTGGETNSLDDFWSAQPPSNDQTARAFRDAGVVMMFASLRGGNANPGGKEYFLGEVEDVLAAADRLAKLPYVDPARIYLGGHSTGGTLALLVAESSDRFKAVFALGPVARAGDYPASILPLDLSRRDDLEARLRSPIHWLEGIASLTYVIEGTASPGNLRSLEEICGRKANRRIVCVPVDGANHFSVISRVTKVIAARVAVPSGNDWILRPEEFRQPAAEPPIRR